MRAGDEFRRSDAFQAKLMAAQEHDPFVVGLTYVRGQWQPISHVDVSSRLGAVKQFTRRQCRAALKLNLQKTVRTAIERRLRKVDKEAAR